MNLKRKEVVGKTVNNEVEVRNSNWHAGELANICEAFYTFHMESGHFGMQCYT